MKIIFEAVNGKKGSKEFKSLSEAKAFVLKNKKVIKEAQIMEGPLGSGGFGIGKSFKNRKKANDRVENFDNIEKTKDSFGMRISNYLSKIVKEVAEESFGPDLIGLLSVGWNEHGYFIFSWEKNVYHKMDTDEEDRTRKVNMKSDKYHNRIYMPKLSRYVEQHKSLPSENQVKEYIKKLIEKRFENNLNKMKKTNPYSLTSKNDVDNF